jgi:UPF0755 protein
VTDLLDLDADPPPARRRRRRRRQGIARTLAVLVVLGIVGALAYGGLLVTRGLFGSSDAEDYPGPGSGEVVVQISPGDTAGDVADTLAAEDVVASRQAVLRGRRAGRALHLAAAGLLPRPGAHGRC